ncbi:hypothetical protein Pmani_014912 [Petrolisthes manimaculis]|uniref:Serine/threonine-protein phosphatase n=1 Tax=Petrolisthes manimaculis TaxID=1843537 RepID=A0AAE1PTA5_9EUCA|nr:hypothetical protein Pmani_014912 [Petrolisthes manimaculis]
MSQQVKPFSGPLQDVVSVLVYQRSTERPLVTFLLGSDEGDKVCLPREEVRITKIRPKDISNSPSPSFWRRDVCFSEVAKGLARQLVVGDVSNPQLIQLTRVFVSDKDGHYQHMVFAVQVDEPFTIQTTPDSSSQNRRRKLTLTELQDLPTDQLERRNILDLALHVADCIDKSMMGALMKEVGVSRLWECVDKSKMTSYEALLRAPSYNQDGINILYEEFVRSSYPHSTLSFSDVRDLFTHLGWKDNERRIFRAFDKDKCGELSVEDFFYGMTAVDPKTNHGQGPAEIRCRCIFRYYDENNDDQMERPEVEAMVRDIENIHARDTSDNIIQERIKEAFEIFGVPDESQVPLVNFLSAVGNLKFRGTSVLLRTVTSPILHLTLSLRHPDRKRPSTPDHTRASHKLSKLCKGQSEDRCNSNNNSSNNSQQEMDTTPPCTKAVDHETPIVISSNSQASIPLSEGAFQSQESGGVYSLAQHTVKVRRSGQIIDIHRLLDMERAGEVSDTGLDTDETNDQHTDLRSPTERVKLPNARHRLINRFQSYEAFDNKSLSNEMVSALRFFEQEKKNKPALNWGEVDMVKLGQYIISLCNGVKERFETEPRLLRLSAPCYILGDLHGNYRDLVCFEKGLWRVGPQLTPANFLFLGDYVDRGAYGIEVVSYLFAQKLLAPAKFFLLRGNHEVRDIQQAFTFHRECLDKFGERLGQSVWEAVNTVFDCMPLAAIVDERIFCIHGGIPRLEGDLNELNKIPCPLPNPEAQSTIAWQMMWNDPITAEEYNDDTEKELEVNQGFAYNIKRQTALVFNRAAFANFLKKFGLTHVVRAHEVKQAGFEIQQGGQLMTVFSSSHYCGGSNEAACILLHNYLIRVIRIDTT